MRFESCARLTRACSPPSGSAGRAHEAQEPQRPRAAFQASTRAVLVPGSTRTASQAPWGPAGGRQERASVAQRVLGVKVRQNGISGPLVRRICCGGFTENGSGVNFTGGYPGAFDGDGAAQEPRRAGYSRAWGRPHYCRRGRRTDRASTAHQQG